MKPDFILYSLKNEITRFCFLLMLMFTTTDQLAGQCVADAGEDQALCTFFGWDTTYLGGLPAVYGGTPPYAFLWTYNYSNEWFTYTAEHFLDDVTLANPRIVSDNPFEVTMLFYLTVTDSTGLKCTDSVRVQFSNFIITLDVKFAHIHQGDSTQLYTSVHGGIPPISYQWSPITGLTDPTDVYTFASPQTTTNYNLLVTDSAGCQVWDGFEVFVVPTSSREVQANRMSIDLIPNPLMDMSTFRIFGLQHDDQLEIHVYDLLGRLKKILTIGQGNLNVYRSDFEPGMYTYYVVNNNTILSIRKFLVL
jgi:hypothetical protein